MIRKFNYTGRQRIPRRNVEFTLRATEGGPLEFDAALRLDDLNLPERAAVYVEAYHTASCMRFHFGQIGRIQLPDDRRLVDIPSREVVHFRLKVVDETSARGRILAEASGITATASGRKSLLPVDFRDDLEPEIWRLCIDEDDWPKLEVSNSLAPVNMRDVVRADADFRALVLPEALRQLLRYVVHRRLEDLDSCSQDEWTSCWVRFASRLPGMEGIPIPKCGDPESVKEGWVEAAVQAFCKIHSLHRHYQAAKLRGVA